MRYTIATFDQANIKVYAEDGSGNLVGGVDADQLLTYCYLEGGTLTAALEITRRNITGRSKRKITTREYDYRMSTDNLYFSIGDELDVVNIFNRTKRLRLNLEVFDITRIDESDNNLKNYTHSLSQAVATSFAITGRDNDRLTCSANFEAESYFKTAIVLS